MPWKIKQDDSYPFGEDARIHFWDPKASIHMVLWINDGTCDLFIGASTPEDADVYIEIQTENNIDIVQLRNITPALIGIVSSILRTMGVPEDILNTVRKRMSKDIIKNDKND